MKKVLKEEKIKKEIIVHQEEYLKINQKLVKIHNHHFYNKKNLNKNLELF